MPCLGQCNPLDYESVGREELNDGEIDLYLQTIRSKELNSITIYMQPTFIVSFLLHCNSNLLKILRIYKRIFRLQ